MKKSQCLQCGAELISKGSRPKKWCNHKCRGQFRYENDVVYQQRNTYEEQIKRSRSRKLYAIKLKGGKCSRCGQRHPAALCFHHVDPKTKNFNIDGRTFGNTKWEKIEKELCKCELLCFNCHQILHFGDYWDNWFSTN